MKRLIVAFSLLIINVLCTVIIGITKVQELLSIMIYFSPIIIDFIIAILYYKKDFKIISSVLLRLVLMFIALVLVFSCIIYFSGDFITSIIALCVFVTVFNIFPALLFYVMSYFLGKTEGAP